MTVCVRVRVCACVQYFSPYVSADMTKMAQAFNTTVAALEDELTQLILEGLINARIDSHSKVNCTHSLSQTHTLTFHYQTSTHTAMLIDSLCEGCGSEEHHVREVTPHGQRVPETSQSDDPPSGCAAQPDPCQGRKSVFYSAAWLIQRFMQLNRRLVEKHLLLPLIILHTPMSALPG